MLSKTVDILVQSTVQQDELVISNDMLVLDIPSHAYNQITDESTSTNTRSTYIRSIWTDGEEKPDKPTVEGHGGRPIQQTAYLCTSSETYCIYHHEQNAPLMLCKRNPGDLSIQFATKLSYRAAQKLIRPNFSRISQMMNESDVFRPEARTDEEPLAHTLDEYDAAAPASRKEIEDEIFRCGLRIFRPPYLQKITAEDINPVIDSIVTQLVGIHLQQEDLFQMITQVPLLLAVDTLCDVYSKNVLLYAVDIIGDTKAVYWKKKDESLESSKHCTSPLQIICLSLRGYVRHKIHYSFRKKSKMVGVELLEELQSHLSPEILTHLVKKAKEVESMSQDTPKISRLAFHCFSPFPETLFRGITVYPTSLDESHSAIGDDPKNLMEIEQKEFMYAPFWNHQGADAITTLHSIMRSCNVMRKVDLASYILPFFCEDSTQPIDDYGLYDDWTNESDLVVMRMGSTASRHDQEIIDDHRVYMNFLSLSSIEIIFPERQLPGMQFHPHREALLDRFLHKNAKEHVLDNESLFTVNNR